MWKTLKHPDVQANFSSTLISWKIMLEAVPLYCGFYERLLRLVGTALRKILERQLVDVAEMATIIREVEALIISRPLKFVYTGFLEPALLSPACFRVGKRLTLLPPWLHPEEAHKSEWTSTMLKVMWKSETIC